MFCNLKDLPKLLTTKLISPVRLVQLCLSPGLPRSREIEAWQVETEREKGSWVVV